jgi:hypothetical protein
MALEYICSQTIMKGKKISIPEGRCNCFKTKSGKVMFFKYNPTLQKGIRTLPKDSAEISFEEYQNHRNWTNYGEPTFYDKEGNIINAR